MFTVYIFPIGTSQTCATETEARQYLGTQDGIIVAEGVIRFSAYNGVQHSHSA